MDNEDKYQYFKFLFMNNSNILSHGNKILTHVQRLWAWKQTMKMNIFILKINFVIFTQLGQSFDIKFKMKNLP